MKKPKSIDDCDSIHSGYKGDICSSFKHDLKNAHLRKSPEPDCDIDTCHTLDLVLRDFENFILSYDINLHTFHPFINTAFLEMLKNGGGRFRPMLLFSIVLANNKDFIKNAFLVAFALECLHTYSLIHDDLPCMDDADLRRGKTTLHVKYDETSAVLIGDGLNTFSFYLISLAQLSDKMKVDLIRELSFNGGIHGMVLGQALDCYYQKDELNLEQLRQVHINKTAKLIATSLKMGGIIANLPLKMLDLLYECGLLIGLYFQVRDDIFDSTKTSSELGKSANNDISKNSYVNLLGLNGAKNELDSLKNQISEKLQEIGIFLPDTKEILHLALKPLLKI